MFIFSGKHDQPQYMLLSQFRRRALSLGARCRLPLALGSLVLPEQRTCCPSFLARRMQPIGLAEGRNWIVLSSLAGSLSAPLTLLLSPLLAFFSAFSPSVLLASVSLLPSLRLISVLIALCVLDLLPLRFRANIFV